MPFLSYFFGRWDFFTNFTADCGGRDAASFCAVFPGLSFIPAAVALKPRPFDDNFAIIYNLYYCFFRANL